MGIAPELGQILLELRARFEVEYGERLVGLLLYGSQARGEADAESDIDVLVGLRGFVRGPVEISRTGSMVTELSLAHDVVISCVFVSEERFQSEGSPLLLNAQAEGVAV